MTITRRMLSIAVGCLLIFAHTCAYAGNARITVQLKWIHQFQFAGLYMALKKGYYQDAGLDVRLIEGGVNTDAIDYVSSHQAAYGVADSSALLAAARGKPIMALGAIFQHSPLALMVNKDAGITKLADLRGKRIMLQAGSDASILAALKRTGIAAPDFTRQANSQNIEDLITGKTDAFSIYTMDQPYQMEKRGIPYRIFYPEDQGIDFYGDIIITSANELRQHPERAHAMMRATAKGWAYALNHIAETTDLILLKYHRPQFSRQRLLFEAHAIAKIIMHDVIPVGYMNLDRWQRIAQADKELGLMPAGYPVTRFIDQPVPSIYDVVKRYIWQLSVAGLVLLLALIIAWNMFLRRTVRTRSRQLRIQNKHLQRAQSIARMGSWALDLSDLSIHCSDEIYRIFEMDHADISYQALLDRIHPDDKEKVRNAHVTSLKERIPYQIECRLLMPDQRIKWLRSEWNTTFDQAGRGLVSTGAIQDITEHKQAELERERLTLRYRNLFTHSHEALFILDPERGTIIETNHQAQMMLGFTQEELTGRPMADLHPDEVQELSAFFAAVMETGKGQTDTLTCLTKSGEKRHADMSAFLIEEDGRKFAVTAVRDITERRQAALILEKANKQTVASRAFLEKLIELAQVGIIVHRGWKILMVNPYLLKRMGARSQNMVLGKDYSQFIHPDDRPASIQRIQQLEKHGGEYQNAPVRAVSLSGECIYFEVSSTVFQYEGEATILTISIDVTEKHKASESQRKLSAAIEQAGESILITDSNGIIEYTNPAFTEVTGYSAEEAVGQTPRLLKSGNQDDAFYANMWNTITSGNVWHGKVIDRRKDGSFYPAMLTISPIFDASGDATHFTHFIGIQADLSSLEDMENRFHQAQKMEAIGIMVGGIAHNFNNMLAGMTCNLYLAKMKAQAQPEVVEKLSNVEELSHSAADMIAQLLAFARKDMVIIKAMPLMSFIKQTLKLLRASVPENIAVDQELCVDDLQVKGDATQLHQVLANLVNNARDAVEDVDEPRITIRLESFHADAVFIESRTYAEEGSYAHLSVADNGIGIPEAQIEHLFEPFFTTKEQGKGTGLGLSMVYGAMKTHHGFVEVDSAPGKGATFHLYIPLLERKEIAAEPVQQQSAIQGRGELILLADDEPMVRNVMAEVLESLGYRVLKAEDGLQAMEQFKAHQEEISLALLDVVMPHLGGMPLASKIREINSDVPVIFLTGYDQNHVLNGNEPMANSEILTKPVNFDILSHSIRQLL